MAATDRPVSRGGGGGRPLPAERRWPGRSRARRRTPVDEQLRLVVVEEPEAADVPRDRRRTCPAVRSRGAPRRPSAGPAGPRRGSRTHRVPTAPAGFRWRRPVAHRAARRRSGHAPVQSPIQDVDIRLLGVDLAAAHGRPSVRCPGQGNRKACRSTSSAPIRVRRGVMAPSTSGSAKRVDAASTDARASPRSTRASMPPRAGGGPAAPVILVAGVTPALAVSPSPERRALALRASGRG